MKQREGAGIPTSEDTLEGSVPGYTLVRALGTVIPGSLARTFECRAERTGDVVVLKVLTREAALDRAMVQRILRESRVVAGLRTCPCVVRVYDVGEAGAGPYVAFEKIKGTPTSVLLERHGRMAVNDALAVAREAAKALEAASGVGVAHRDVKPANLFKLEDGSIKLTDFGFAAPLTRLGGPPGVFGTPAYLAPELLKGMPHDVRSDIYALGATLFHLVTAKPLFDGSTADVLAAHTKKPVPSIATMVPEAGIAVVDVIYKLLHKDPAKRPQSARDVVGLLDEAMGKKRSSSSSSMQGVGGPAPSEPQWPTATWTTERSSSALGALPPPPPSGMGGTPARGSAGAASAAAAAASSPFDNVADAHDATYTAQPTGVMGTLKQMSVTEILQMLEIGKKSARVDVQVEGVNGLIHVHDGAIVHATAGKHSGEKAVVFFCQKKEGFFRIHYEKEPCEKNVHRPTQFVLLEAMKEIDETNSMLPSPRAKQSAPPPSPSTPTPGTPATATPAARSPGALQGPASTWPEMPAAKHERTQSSSSSRRPRPGAGADPGDGIDFDERAVPHTGSLHDATLEVAPVQLGSHVDDPTLPEATLRRRAPVAARFMPALVEVSAQARQLARRGYRELEVRLEPLRRRLQRVHPRLGVLSPVISGGAIVAAALLLVLGVVRLVGAAGSSLAYDDALEDVLDGHAADVIDELERVNAADRTFDQDLVLGHAWAARGEEERALELYRSAVPAGHADELALKVLLNRLDASAPDDEIDLLVLWPDDDVEELLAALSVDPRPRVRAAAVAILVERGRIGLLDVEATALADFVMSQTCTGKRIALATLRYAGKGKPALQAVDRVGRAYESCFGQNELRNAYAAIKRRVDGE